MQIRSLTYDLKRGKWSGPFPPLDSPRTLVLGFGDPALLDAPGPFKTLKSIYPESIIAGCSGSGEIVGTSVADDVLTVTVARFERTGVMAVSADCGGASRSFAVGEALAKRLNKAALRAVFVLSDGLKVNGSELVRGFNSVLDERVVVTGGLAGDGARFQRTWVGMGESVASGVVVAVGFYGDHLVVSHGSKGGWDKFGPERVVTKSEGNVLYELDGKAALGLYKEYLGDKAGGLPASGLLFPLALRTSAKDERVLVRTLLAVDEAAQSMTFAGDVPVGHLAQLMKADFDRLIAGAANAATTVKTMVGLNDPNTLAVAVSCVGRRLVLGERTDEEIEAVRDVLPQGSTVTGFYSYGELSPYATGRCDLHNQTMTLTTFTESRTPQEVRPLPKAPAPAPRPSMPPPAASVPGVVTSAPPRFSAPRVETGAVASMPSPLPSVPPRYTAPVPRTETGTVHSTPTPVPSAPPSNRPPPPRLTRLASGIATSSNTATTEIERSGQVTVVRIRGKLSESFQGRQVAAAVQPMMLFDLAEVERITSFGVREWLQMMGELESKGAKVHFARCSEAVVNQLGMIRRFAGGGKVLSFFAPYTCGSCATAFSALIDCETDAESLKARVLPQCECPGCGAPASFDDDAASYLASGPLQSQPLRAPYAGPSTDSPRWVWQTPSRRASKAASTACGSTPGSTSRSAGRG